MHGGHTLIYIYTEEKTNTRRMYRRGNPYHQSNFMNNTSIKKNLYLKDEKT